MAALLLTEKDVEGFLRMEDALGAVEQGLRALGRGEATNRPRQRAGTRETTVNVMLAAWPARGYAGFKYYTTSREGIRFWVHLFDIATSELVAVIQADRLGQQRTGAASGVATKYLARPDASTIGIVGTGWQAESQLEAVCAVRAIRQIRCYGRDKAHRERFAKKMSSLLQVTVQPIGSAEEAIRNADVRSQRRTRLNPSSTEIGYAQDVTSTPWERIASRLGSSTTPRSADARSWRPTRSSKRERKGVTSSSR